jgi:hypothetical protein
MLWLVKEFLYSVAKNSFAMFIEVNSVLLGCLYE